MKKSIFGDELRALFRDIFKIEVKALASDIGFLGKLGGTKLNHERLSIEQRKWLQNIGVLTTDPKNQAEFDDRTIYSHVLSAVYAGLFGLNFVDVTAHCVDTIKEQKGLKPEQKLVDYLSATELRQFSIALYTLSNEIRQNKKAGKLQNATMSNFYFVADRAFLAGLNARRNAVYETNSEFSTREVKYCATNILNNIDASIKIDKFSFKNMQPKLEGEEKEFCQNQKNTYFQTMTQIREILENRGYNLSEIAKFFAAIDEGFYKSKYFRTHEFSIAELIYQNDTMLSKQDLDAQNTKILFAKVSLEKLLKRSGKNALSLSDLFNCAFRSGAGAREDCIIKYKTSPEFFSSFSSALLLDREKQQKPKM